MIADGYKVPRAPLRAPLPVKQFRFLFELEYGVLFGGGFECHAHSENGAWQKLEQQLPGAGDHVKSVHEIH